MLIGGGALRPSLTAFVGRARELREATGLLRGTRLLTVTGPGGCGKTRFALKLAEQVETAYQGGLALAELESVRNPEFVMAALSAAVGGTAAASGGDVISALCQRPGPVLLIVDNCEHLVETAARSLDRLLAGAANVTVLATSREALSIPGETVWRLPSLSLPEADPTAAPLAPDALLEFDAVKLFCSRASERSPGFELSEANAAAVLGICRHLGGIPLALELAAARVSSMSLDEIAEHLRVSFRLLTGGNRTAIERHQALQATMDWSYDLLDTRERALFERLSAFSGSFDLAAVQAVCSVGDLDAEETVAVLATLVDKSMVMPAPAQTAGLRYRLIDPLRQYAQHQLSRAETAPLRRRHAEYFLSVVERASGERAESQVNAELLDDEANLRAALEWAVGDDPALLIRLITRHSGHWMARAQFREGLTWTQLALGSGAGAELDVLELQRLMGVFRGRLGDFDGSLAALDEAVQGFRSAGATRGLARALVGRSAAHAQRGDIPAARSDLREAVALDDALPPVAFGGALNNLALLEFYEGHSEEALRLLEQSEAVARRAGSEYLLSTLLHSRGGILARTGQDTKALVALSEALDLALARGDLSHAANTFEALAPIAIRRGRPAEALAALAAAGRLRSVDGSVGMPDWSGQDTQQAEAEARSLLDEETAAQAWSRGATTPLGRLRELFPATDPAAGRGIAITRRERECARQVADGLTNKEIAARMGIGVRTVETHLDNLRQKLNLRTRAQVASWAVDAGLTRKGSVATP